MITIKQPDEVKLASAFEIMDSDTRNAFKETLEKRKEEISQIIDENSNEASALLEAEKESKLADVMPKLAPLWDRIQRRKDQNSNLTLKEYQDITGKRYPAHIINYLGKEYVAWDNAIDNIAAEYGYETPEDLYNDLENLMRAREDVDGFKDLIKISEDSLKSVDRNIKILNRVKEGKYAIETGDSEREVAETNRGNKQDLPADREDRGRTDEQVIGIMQPSTSVQTGLGGFGITSAQGKIFEEVSGKESSKPPLIEVKETVKPLKGQLALTTVRSKELKEKTQRKINTQIPMWLSAKTESGKVYHYPVTKRKFRKAWNKPNRLVSIKR
jgi:hypothetical protein